MFKPNTLVWQTVVHKTFKFSILTTALASLGVLTACTSTPQKSTPAKTSTVAKAALLDADSFDSLEDLLYATDMRAVEGDRLLILRHGDVWKRMTVGFKMDLNRFDSRIEAQRGWFISRQPYLDRLSARASRYIYYTVKEAERRGLPTELALLPVIESSYDPAATSSAAAAGLWQFIPSTGKIYGLRQSDLYDGRRDVVESTRAAYEYLSSLYNQFGSWELALASYNAGPGRIQQAINRNKAAGLATDYWSLKLPTETMNYVPRFIAVAQIIKNQHQYGVSLPPIANRPHFREVTIPGAIDLNQLSSITGVSRGELYALNPAHRGNYTDPLAPRRILIPNEVNANVDHKIASMTTVSGSGGLWAGGAAPPPTLSSSTTISPSTPLVINKASELPNSSAITTQVTTRNPTTASATAVTSKPATPSVAVTSSVSATTIVPALKQPTPQGSNALAAFAANADVPSAPRLPVSITPAQNIRQIPVEPPISEAEKQIILAQETRNIPPSGKSLDMLVQQVVEPKPTDAERQQVIQELEQIAPKGTEIVDPLDGKIRLTAIQSSQSIAEQKGEEVKIGYAYPKAVSEAVQKTDRDAVARNAGKAVVETQNEVVVVQPKGKRDIYTVQSGDTLANIATRFGVNWRDIAKWNQINADAPLYVGSRLYLYDVKPVVSAAPQRPERYTVKAGDSLTAISQQYGLSLQELAAWNNLGPTSNVLIGQRLTLVEPKNFKVSSASSSSAVTTPTTPPPAIRESATKIDTESYTVKRGEFLQQIAERYGLSNAELAALTPNLTSTSQLLVGQRIRVPKASNQSEQVAATETRTTQTTSQSSTPDIKTTIYTVVAGDYLSNVAAKHKISLADLAALNHLKNNSQINVGQKLKVPYTEPARPSSYRIQSGDTLIGVAAKFDLSVADLAAFNNIKTDTLVQRGQVLKLDGDRSASRNTATITEAQEPVKTDHTAATPSVEQTAFNGQTETYTVKSGESLTALANRYNLSVNTLAQLNNLSARANLRVGQKIKVPQLTVSYKVKRGDSLIALARQFGVSTEELATMNKIRPDTQLQLGQTLTVPNK